MLWAKDITIPTFDTLLISQYNSNHTRLLSLDLEDKVKKLDQSDEPNQIIFLASHREYKEYKPSKLKSIAGLFAEEGITITLPHAPELEEKIKEYNNNNNRMLDLPKLAW